MILNYILENISLYTFLHSFIIRKLIKKTFLPQLIFVKTL